MWMAETTEKPRHCVVEMRAKGITSSPRDAVRRFMRMAKPRVGTKL